MNDSATQDDVSLQLAEIQGQLNMVLAELRALRSERLPASPEKIEELLAALHTIFNDAEFTASWALETAIDNDPDAVRLLQSITAVAGSRPGIKKLSRLLNKVTGTYGGHQLSVANPHGRDGTTFIVRVTM